MLADAQALIDSGGERNSKDEHGATLVCAGTFCRIKYGEAPFGSELFFKTFLMFCINCSFMVFSCILQPPMDMSL